MSSNAPGQLLGYSIQFPRALYHLLKCGPGDSVCVEYLGDVATFSAEGKLLTEEDKSSIVGNPITNKSTDLWKTFFNWVNAEISGDINIQKTKFVLYCNKQGRVGIVNKFSSARNKEEIIAAINYAKTKLANIKKDHPIWEYYDFVINKNEKIFIEIVERFELQIGNGSGYDEVRKELLIKIIPEKQIEFLIESISGWLIKKIIEKIVLRKSAIITWKEFNTHFLTQFERVRKYELIDFTLQKSYGQDMIENQIKTSPLYLKQLEKIGSSNDEIFEAVTEYLKADVNREKWIENEIIDADIAKEFEEKLKTFWTNQSKKIKIVNKDLNEEDQGQLLLIDCKSRLITIRDMDPPTTTIAGTYHALANEPVIGWHPNWDKEFIPKKG